MCLVALHLTHRLHRNDAVLRGHAVALLDQGLEAVDDDGLQVQDNQQLETILLPKGQHPRNLLPLMQK